MITRQQWMQMVNYRITEGGDYGWQCFGNSSYYLDSCETGDQGYSTTILIDTESDNVYQVEVHDEVNRRSYRMINPDYAASYDAECVRRNVDRSVAYDDVPFIDLETVGDFLEKGAAIIAGKPYDPRVVIPLDLTKDMAYDLMSHAHELDITLNQYMEMVLTQVLDTIQSKPENDQ